MSTRVYELDTIKAVFVRDFPDGFLETDCNSIFMIIIISRYPVLSRAHQQLVVSMVEHEAQVIVSGARRSNIEFFVQYLHRVWRRRPNPANDPMLSYARG